MRRVFIVTVKRESRCSVGSVKIDEVMEVYESRTDAVAAMKIHFEKYKAEWLKDHIYYDETDFENWSSYTSDSAHIDSKVFFNVLAVPFHERKKIVEKK